MKTKGTVLRWRALYGIAGQAFLAPRSGLRLWRLNETSGEYELV
jgi:hypothetical protein